MTEQTHPTHDEIDTARLIARTSTTFDLESYINRYNTKSETRLQRLLYVASRTGAAHVLLTRHNNNNSNRTSSNNDKVLLEPLAKLCKLAYEMARDQMVRERNVVRYIQIFGNTNGSNTNPPSPTLSATQLQQQVESLSVVRDPAADVNVLGPIMVQEDEYVSGSMAQSARLHKHLHQIECDEGWLVSAQQQHAIKADVLECRLVSAKSSLCKESIRAAYLELGDFWKDSGMLKESLKCHLRTRDYCINSKQSAQMCLAVIELGIDMRNFTHVNSYVNKAENTAHLVSNDPLSAAKFRAASGISALYANSFREAANAFTDLSMELSSSEFDTVLSAEDIALYGSILALASLDREELHLSVLDSSNLKQRLELLPWMRDALRHLSRAEYGEFLSILESKRGEMMLDIHLSSYVSDIFEQIHDRCLIQYFIPFSSLSLETVGKSLIMTSEETQEAVAKLIARNKILGRINTLENVLRAKPEPNRRLQSIERLQEYTETLLTQVQSALLRLSCLQSNVVVSSIGNKRGGRTRRNRQNVELKEDMNSSDDGDDNSMMIDPEDEGKASLQ